MVDRTSVKDRVKEICKLRNSKTIYEFAMNHKYHLDDEDRDMIIDTICNNTNGSTYIYKLALESIFYNENNKDIFVNALCRIKFVGSIVNFAKNVKYLNNDDYNKLAKTIVEKNDSYGFREFIFAIGIFNKNIRGRVVLDDEILRKFLNLVVDENDVINIFTYGCNYVNILMSDEVLFDKYLKKIFGSNEGKIIIEFSKKVLDKDVRYINKFINYISNIKNGEIIYSFLLNFGLLMDDIAVQKLLNSFRSADVIKDDDIEFGFMNYVSSRIMNVDFYKSVLESNNPIQIYYFARSHEDKLKTEEINELAKKMCNTSNDEHIEYIKLFLSNISKMSNEAKNELAKVFCRLVNGNILEINEFLKMGIDYFDNTTISAFVDAVCLLESTGVDQIYDFSLIMLKYLDDTMINKLAVRLSNGGSLDVINKFMKKFIKNLSKKSISMIVLRICECRNFENIYWYTKDFVEYFSPVDFENIVNGVCFNATSKFILSFAEDFIGYIESSSITKLVDVICRSTKTEDIYNFTRCFIKYLDHSTDLKKLKNAICNTNSISHIYDFLYIDGLDDSLKEEIKLFIKNNLCKSKFVLELLEDGIKKAVSFDELVDAVIKTGNAQYIYDFASGFENISDKYVRKLCRGFKDSTNGEYICRYALKFGDKLSDVNISLLTSKILNSKSEDVDYILAFFEKYVKKMDYNDFCNFSRKLICIGAFDKFYDFVNRYISTFDKKNLLNLLINEICRLGNEEFIYNMATKFEKLTNYQINLLTNAICKSKNAEYIYKYAMDVSVLDNDNLKGLSEAIMKTNHIGYIYDFLLNVPNLSDFLKERLMDFCIINIYAFNDYLLKKRNDVSSLDKLENMLMGDMNTKENVIKSFSKCIISYEMLITHDREKFLPYVNRALDRYQNIVMARQVMNEAFNYGNAPRGKK